MPWHGDLASLVLRTGFGDEAAWEAVRTALDQDHPYPCTTCVSDPRFAGVGVGAPIEEDAAAPDGEEALFVFLADATTMADPAHRLLAVDLHDQPGRTFRVPPRRVPEIATNLAIANMDFAEFADAADGSGTYRGLGDA